MAKGLRSRTYLAAAIGAVIITAALVSLVFAVTNLRDQARQQHHTAVVLTTATHLDEVLDDLQGNVNAYLVSPDPMYVANYRARRAELAKTAASLIALTAHDDAETATRARELAMKIEAYERKSVDPVMTIAQTNVGAGRAYAARLGPERGGLPALDARMKQFLATGQTSADQKAHDLDSSATYTISLLWIRLAGSLLVVGLLLYILLRRIVRPIRALSQAAGLLAQGEPAHVKEEGLDEIAEFGRRFNEMADAVERQRQESAQQNSDLERLAGLLRTVLDSTVDGIVLTDTKGNVQVRNRPFAKLGHDLDLPSDGTAIDRLRVLECRVTDPERFTETLKRLERHPDDVSTDEFELTNPYRAFMCFTAPVRADSGRSMGRIWTLRETTHEREVDRMRDDFVAAISHELLTPLTSMIGFVDMLREGEAGPLTDEQQRFLAIVQRSSGRLQRLLHDLLFVAQLDATGLDMAFTDIDLGPLVEESVESVADLAQSRTIDLGSTVADEPIELFADRERLAQVLANLLSNALKFTPEGGTVNVTASTSNGHAVLEVVDTGIGIPVPEQPRVFERFFRSSSSTARQVPGTGLGLMISKAIVDAHRGTISLSSTPGAGTCLRVELPLATVTTTRELSV